MSAAQGLPSVEELRASVGLGSAAPSRTSVQGVRAPAGLPVERFGVDELRSMPEPEWLVEGLLPRVGTAQVYGPSNLGKTFVVIDLVLSIASGQPHWHEYPVVPDRARVAYVAIEDEGDWQHRVGAWEEAHPGADTSGLITVFPRGQLDLAAPDAAERWIRYFRDDDLAVLVVDTQAQASGGAEENSNTEMGRMMSNLRQISTRLGCAVLTVHHTGTVGTRARGASSQIGALDVQVSVLPPRGRGENAGASAATDFVEQPVTGVVQVEKNRRARKRPGTAFRLEPSGRSVWARPIARASDRARIATRAEAQRLQVIRALVRMEGSADSAARIVKEVRDHNEPWVVSERAFKEALNELCDPASPHRCVRKSEGARRAMRFELEDPERWARHVADWVASQAQHGPLGVFPGAD